MRRGLPTSTRRKPPRPGAHLLARHLIQIRAAPRRFPRSAPSPGCGEPLTLLHLVSNLNPFHISIYYVWTLRVSTRGGFLTALPSQPAGNQPTGSQDLVQRVSFSHHVSRSNVQQTIIHWVYNELGHQPDLEKKKSYCFN